MPLMGHVEPVGSAQQATAVPQIPVVHGEGPVRPRCATSRHLLTLLGTVGFWHGQYQLMC